MILKQNIRESRGKEHHADILSCEYSRKYMRERYSLLHTMHEIWESSLSSHRKMLKKVGFSSLLSLGGPFFGLFEAAGGQGTDGCEAVLLLAVAIRSCLAFCLGFYDPSSCFDFFNFSFCSLK